MAALQILGGGGSAGEQAAREAADAAEKARAEAAEAAKQAAATAATDSELKAETERAEAAEATKLDEKALGATVMSQTDSRVESLMEGLAGALVPVYYGDDPTVARPEGATHVLWIGLESVTPEHEVGFLEDPNGFDLKLGLAALPE